MLHATDVPHRCQTWNDSAGNQSHCTTENAKCNRSLSTSSKFLLIAAPSPLPPNWRILKMWCRIRGNPVFWKWSAGLDHMKDTQLRKSGIPADHSHKINEQPWKVTLFVWTISLASIKGILAWALPSYRAVEVTYIPCLLVTQSNVGTMWITPHTHTHLTLLY